MRRPGILGAGVAAYQEHDQFDQSLIELGIDPKTISQPIGRLGDIGPVNPYRKRPAELAARPRAHDFVIELLLTRAELFSFHLIDTSHARFSNRYPCVTVHTRKRGAGRRRALRLSGRSAQDLVGLEPADHAIPGIVR